MLRLTLLLSLALAVSPLAAQADARAAGALPTHGIFVMGVSLAGVKLGMTQAQVKKVLGVNYTQCTVANSPSLCKEPVWLYEYTRGEPLVMAVRFRKGIATAVFTLGAVTGWKTKEGLKMYDPVTNIYSFYQTPIYTKCLGFEALSSRRGKITTSIYTATGVVYGFALTAPGEAICQ